MKILQYMYENTNNDYKLNKCVRTQRCSTWPHPTNQAVAKLGTVPGAQ